MSRFSKSASATLYRVLADSGSSKSALCAHAGISRALLDDYLRAFKQPSLAQLERIADAAGLRIVVTVAGPPRPVSAEYVAVMELASELAGKRDSLPPLAFPHDLWRRAS